MRLFFLFSLPLFFLSCAEMKKQIEEAVAETPVVKDTVVEVAPTKIPPCLSGNIPQVLDTLKYPPVSRKEEQDFCTYLYDLGNGDSLTVKLGTCENPYYEYTYSTSRYQRGIDEVRFYYGAVNSFYMMLYNEHHPGAYKPNDLIEASEAYLAQHKNVTIPYLIPFISEKRSWTYTLRELKTNGERRTMRWRVS